MLSWIPITQGCFVPSLVEIGPVVLEKKIFQFCHYIFCNLSICQCYFVIISPWKRAGPFILNKLEFPSAKDALCQVWLKLTQWIWRRIFLNFIIVFSLFRNYLPLENDVALHFNKFDFPSPKDALCRVWLKLALWFCRRGWKCEKFITTTTTQQTMDKMWSEKLTLDFGSGELKRN